MIAFVLGVIAFSNSLGSRLNVTGSTSTNTVRACRRAIAPTVATKVNGTVITSSPGLTPSAISANSNASDPDAHPKTYSQPTCALISSSKALTSGPMMKICDSSTLGRPLSSPLLECRHIGLLSPGMERQALQQ